MKIHNPIGRMISMGNGYFRQSITLGKGRGYIKVWHHGQVIDRAMTIKRAQEIAKKHATSGLFMYGDKNE